MNDRIRELEAALALEKKKRAALALCYHAQALALREQREATRTACEISLELLEGCLPDARPRSTD